VLNPQTNMTSQSRMGVMSMSKTITATAVVKQIAKLSDAGQNISVDSPITSFLPSQWVRGPNVDNLTFRHLMTHTSGLTPMTTADPDCRENLNQANKLSRTFTELLDALNSHRGKGQQKVTVEHVHVHSGGQAVVGMVQTPRTSYDKKISCARTTADAHGGLQGGYNWQLAPSWLLGIEGDISWISLAQTRTRCPRSGPGSFDTMSATNHWLASVRGRWGSLAGARHYATYGRSGMGQHRIQWAHDSHYLC
jgi:Beta-lactamase